jgi:hypothetical protein
MVSQNNSAMIIFPEMCWNNGMLEEWNNDSFAKNPIFQYSIIPGFQGYYSSQTL